MAGAFNSFGMRSCPPPCRASHIPFAFCTCSLPSHLHIPLPLKIACFQIPPLKELELPSPLQSQLTKTSTLTLVESLLEGNTPGGYPPPRISGTRRLAARHSPLATVSMFSTTYALNFAQPLSIHAIAHSRGEGGRKVLAAEVWNALGPLRSHPPSQRPTGSRPST